LPGEAPDYDPDARTSFAHYTMNTDGADQTLLVDTLGQFIDWWPDGRLLVFDGRSSLSVIRGDGPGSHPSRSALNHPAFPDWTS
jgi:hypothetical protein